MEKFLWDSQLPVVTLRGEDSRQFLHGQTTADFLNAQEGEVFHTCWLTPTGQLKALLEVKVSNKILSFIVLSGNIKQLLDGLEKMIFISDKVEIALSKEIRRLQVVSFNKSWKETEAKWLPLDSNLPEEFESYSILKKDKIWEWKIRQGLPSSLYELDGTINPLELGLIELIDFDKGCYLGQETIAKVKNSGQLKCQLRFFISDIKINPGDPLLINSENEKGLEKFGIVTSTLKNNDRFIGLALIRKKFVNIEQIVLADYNTKVFLHTPLGFTNI